MDRLTFGVISVIGLLTYIVTMANGLLDQWRNTYRQRQSDKRIQGRNAIVARLIDTTTQPSQLDALGRAMLKRDQIRNGNVH